MARRNVMRQRKRRMRGRGMWDWVSKASDWLKNNKLISTVGNALGGIGIPYASQIGSVAGSLGYGRRRRHHGRGLRLAGGSISRPFFATRHR